MTIKGGTAMACAACKYQRRKCSKDCPLAPFFPADQPEKFHYAHRLYGVRNIMRILNLVGDECKQDAMTSIIFESAMRARFPIHGCLGIINQLRTQFEHTLGELQLVHTRLAICKQREMASSSHDSSLQQTMPSNTDVVPTIPNYDLLTNGIIGMCLNPSIYEDNHLQSIMVENPSLNNVEREAQSSSFFVPQENSIQQELDVSQYDDIPFDPIIDDRSQEPYDSSGEAVSVSKTELANAAAYFSLT